MKITAWGTLTSEKLPKFISDYATDKMAENRKIKSNMTIQTYEFQKEQKTKAKETLELAKEKKMKTQLDILDELDEESAMNYIDPKISEPFRRFLRELVELDKKIEARMDDINELEDKIHEENMLMDNISDGIELTESGKGKGNADKILLSAINRRSAAVDKDKNSGEDASQEREQLLMKLEDSKRQRKIDAAKRGAKSATKDEDRMAKLSQEFSAMFMSKQNKGASDDIVLSVPAGGSSSSSSSGTEKQKQPLKAIMGLAGVGVGGGGRNTINGGGEFDD